jgi:hypothetical protein
MTTKAADDFDSIAKRLAEIEAEQRLALTGTSAPVTGQEQKTEELPQGYGYAGVDYVSYLNTNKLGSLAHPEWPYAGTAHEWRGFIDRGPRKDNNTVPVVLGSYSIRAS